MIFTITKTKCIHTAKKHVNIKITIGYFSSTIEFVVLSNITTKYTPSIFKRKLLVFSKNGKKDRRFTTGLQTDFMQTYIKDQHGMLNVYGSNIYHLQFSSNSLVIAWTIESCSAAWRRLILFSIISFPLHSCPSTSKVFWYESSIR
jgi:hypothetical protein